MALIECFECSKEISDKAAVCPYCGVPAGQRHPQPQLSAPPAERSFGWLWWLIGTPVALFAVFAIFNSNDPKSEAKSQARQAIGLCWDEQKRKSNSPGQAQFIASACERMESEFRGKFNANP